MRKLRAITYLNKCRIFVDLVRRAL